MFALTLSDNAITRKFEIIRSVKRKVIKLQCNLKHDETEYDSEKALCFTSTDISGLQDCYDCLLQDGATDRRLSLDTRSIKN